MRLIVGGAFQGKREAALAVTGLDAACVTDGASCTGEDLRGARLLIGFHELVRRALAGDGTITPADVEAFVHDPQLAHKDLTIVCNELGCGVVPLQKEDRIWREKTGRLLCEIAAACDEVYRVTAGIAVRIK